MNPTGMSASKGEIEKRALAAARMAGAPIPTGDTA
jgi:hypothetical protein